MRYRFLRFPEGKTKAVTFSYDDGFADDLQLIEILNRYGLKGTFNLYNALFHNKGEYLQLADIHSLLDAGHEIAVHGVNHTALGKCTPLEGIQEVLGNRLALEKTFGRIVQGYAYADGGVRTVISGTTRESICRYLQDLGIVYARTFGGDNDRFPLPENWYNWVPTAHHENPELDAYMAKFLALDVNGQYESNRDPRLFFLWGHSREFTQNNNWDRAERICKTLGSHKDIWYATCIEIYQYVNAYNQLVFSADGTLVYNPTLFTIWFDIDGKLYAITPGETKKLP